MKTFTEVRNTSTPNKTVFNSRVGKYPVKIVQTKKGFTTYVDGDLLDTYKSQSQALQSVKTAIKELP